MMEDEQLWTPPVATELVKVLRLWAGRRCDDRDIEEHRRVKQPVLHVLRAADELERMRAAIKAMHTGLSAGSCTCEDCRVDP